MALARCRRAALHIARPRSPESGYPARRCRTRIRRGTRVQVTTANGSAGDWVLKQDEIVIRAAAVNWQDELRGAPPLRLDQLDFLLVNEGRHHRFALRAAPPPEHASPLDIRGDLAGRTLARIQEWNGRIYAGLDHVDLAAWQTWVDYPFDLRGGRGALRLWLGFASGRLNELAADVELSEVAARFGSELPLFEMQTMRGQLGAKETTSFRADRSRWQPGHRLRRIRARAHARCEKRGRPRTDGFHRAMEAGARACTRSRGIGRAIDRPWSACLPRRILAAARRAA